jgi:hypothetical protein
MMKHSLGVAWFFALLLIGTAFADAATTGQCNPTKTKYLASEAVTPATTVGTVDFFTVNEGTIIFTQGGTSQSCVIVQFFLVVSVSGNFAYARALLDGTAGNPDEVVYYGSENAGRADVAGAMAFVFPSVAPGKHKIKIQIGASSGSITGFQHTMLVLHQ